MQMNSFWWSSLLFSVLIFSAFWFYIKYTSRVQHAQIDRRNANVLAFKVRRVELDDELAKGLIDNEVYQQLLLDAKDQLLAEVHVDSSTAGDDEVRMRSKTSLLLIIFTALAIPVGALFMYLPQGLSLGATQDFEIKSYLEQLTTASSAEQYNERLLLLSNYLEQRFDKISHREDLVSMLAEIQTTQRNYAGAEKTYQTYLDTHPENASILARLAQTRFILNGNQFNDAIGKLLNEALALNPNEPVALGLLGMQAYQAKQFETALQYWQEAVGLYPEQSSERNALLAGIEIIQEKLGLKATDPKGENNDSSIAAVKVYVSIDKELIDKALIADGTTEDTPVFIFARPTSGSPMPLAAKKVLLKQLPLELVLSERDAMTALTLASVDEVYLMARVAISGDPLGKSGDLINLEQQAAKVLRLSEDKLPIMQLVINGVQQ